MKNKTGENKMKNKTHVNIDIINNDNGKKGVDR